MLVKDTVCRLCSSCCPVKAYVKDDKLLAVERKSSMPAGKRLDCPKLKAAPDIVYAPERLLTPMMRASRDSRLQPVSWEQALERIALELGQIKDQNGAQAVAWLRGMAADWGAPWDYANRLMNAFGSPNTIGNGSVCHVAREMAHNYTYGAMTLPQPKDSRCILVWGKNDRNTAPGTWESILETREKGAKLIVIDPVKTKPAELADLWLRIRPGQDGILAMSMLEEILKEGLIATEFVDRYCLGLDGLRDAVQAYPAERVARDMWLSPDEIRTAARMYATNKPACIIDGNGLDMQLTTFQTTRAVCMLRALTGNLDKQGGDLIPQPLATNDIQLRKRLPKDRQPITQAYRLFNEFHPNWGLHAQSCLIDALVDADPYPLQALIVQSGNPAVTMTESRRVRQALQRCKFLAVIDLFMTQTTSYADVVLPASSCFEKVQLNRAYMRNNRVILQDQVIAPLGQSLPDWEIVFELGRRLGLGADFPWPSVEQAIDYQLQPTGISVDQLRRHPDGLQTEALEFEKYKSRGFATPSRKVELSSRRLAEAGHSPVPLLDPEQSLDLSLGGRSDDYELIGISGQRDNRFTHTQFHTIPSLTGDRQSGYAHIHPLDARTRGISSQDLVRIATPKGAIRMRARVSDLVHQGSVCIDWGWGDLDPDANLNLLTDDQARDPITATPANRNFWCSVTKEEG